MKKLSTVLCFLLVFVMILSPVCYAKGDNTDTLADWDIRITVPDGATAVLEGDDYWITPWKLNRQVRFLEENPECSMVFSRIKLLDEKTAAIEIIANNTTMIQMTLSPLSFQNAFIAYSLRTASLNWRPRSS